MAVTHYEHHKNAILYMLRTLQHVPIQWCRDAFYTTMSNYWKLLRHRIYWILQMTTTLA